jgi:hypothetical protein
MIDEFLTFDMEASMPPSRIELKCNEIGFDTYSHNSSGRLRKKGGSMFSGGGNSRLGRTGRITNVDLNRSDIRGARHKAFKLG